MRALLIVFILMLSACDWLQPTIESAAAVCLYEQTGIGSPFAYYTDPRNGEPELIGELEFRPYVMVSRTELWYEIALDNGETGWVRWGTGWGVGDCGDVPLDRMRPVPPEDICTLYLDPDETRDYVLYQLPNNNSEIAAAMPEGEYVPVEGRTDYDYYRLRLADGTTGWLLEPSQALYYQRALNGTCENIPYENVSTGPGG